jgi:hypothetical protein
VRLHLFAFAAAALLAACANGATFGIAPPTAEGAPAAHPRPSWYREAPAAIRRGAYVAEYYTNDILGYAADARKNLPPVCSLPAAYVVDVEVDPAGNLVDPDGGSRTVSVFRGPQMCGPQLGSFPDRDGQPSDAATLDAVAHPIYVANLQAEGQSYGNVSVCTLSGGCTRVLSSGAIRGQLFAVAEDAAGNVYASGYPTPSVSGPGSGAALVWWKAGKGKGASIAAYRNTTPGGLDVDRQGRLLALDTFGHALWVYTGCPAACVAHGPFALQGESVFGKVNAQGDVFQAADSEYGQIDVYRYAGVNGVRYLYSYDDGMSPSGDVEGIALDPHATSVP